MNVIAVFLFLTSSSAHAVEECPEGLVSESFFNDKGEIISHMCHGADEICSTRFERGADGAYSMVGGCGPAPNPPSEPSLLPPVDGVTPDVEGYSRPSPPEEKKLPPPPVRKPAADNPVETHEIKPKKIETPKKDAEGLENDRPATMSFEPAPTPDRAPAAPPHPQKKARSRAP